MTTSPLTEFQEHAEISTEGFLSPLIDQFKKEIISDSSQHFDYAKDLNRFAMKCWAIDDDNLEDKDIYSSHSTVSRLMARAMGAYQGAIKLVEIGMHIEAATLVRTIFESAFWMHYFIREPNEATEHFKIDELKAKIGRAESLSKEFEKQPIKNALRLKEIEKLKAQLVGKKKAIGAKELADKAGKLNAYRQYRLLCGLASHASILSTDHYIVYEAGKKPFHRFGPDFNAIHRVLPDLTLSFLHCIKAYMISSNNHSSDAEFERLKNVYLFNNKNSFDDPFD